MSILTFFLLYINYIIYFNYLTKNCGHNTIHQYLFEFTKNKKCVHFLADSTILPDGKCHSGLITLGPLRKYREQ